MGHSFFTSLDHRVSFTWLLENVSPLFYVKRKVFRTVLRHTSPRKKLPHFSFLFLFFMTTIPPSFTITKDFRQSYSRAHKNEKQQNFYSDAGKNDVHCINTKRDSSKTYDPRKRKRKRNTTRNKTRSIAWLIDCSNDWLYHWLIDWLIALCIDDWSFYPTHDKRCINRKRDSSKTYDPRKRKRKRNTTRNKEEACQSAEERKITRISGGREKKNYSRIKKTRRRSWS